VSFALLLGSEKVTSYLANGTKKAKTETFKEKRGRKEET
jgi:hypothetical protein